MKTVIVLGMHRSMTSLVAKGLVHSGDCHMGKELLGAGHGNSKGHFENINFIYLNDFILNRAGGSWDNPPPEYDILKAGEELSQEIERLVRGSERNPVWGWKDPRTTLTIRCYMPYLVNPVFITCFRDPKKVAKSLMIRDGSNYNQNLALAKEYNKRLLRFLTEQTQ
jgi:hypothetical protein